MQCFVSVAFFVGKLWLLTFDFALAERIQSAQHWGQVISRAGENDMFEFSLSAYGTDGRIEVIQHDDDTSAGIRHLVLHFASRIKRVCWNCHGSSPQSTIKSDRILGDIG